jgi:mRNA interferase MazF
MAAKKKALYSKDFDRWNALKKKIDRIPSSRVLYFFKREIWFCYLGLNIGDEQDGKNDDFARPVLIIRRYNDHLFMGIPLSTKIKFLPFYLSVGDVAGIPAMAIISQMRPFSSKRLIKKIFVLNEKIFEATKKAASEYIFGS